MAVVNGLWVGLGIRRGRDDRDQNREISHFSRAAANFGFFPEGNGMYPGSVPGIISMDVDTKENLIVSRN